MRAAMVVVVAACAACAACTANPGPAATFTVGVSVPSTISRIVVDGVDQMVPSDGALAYSVTYPTYADATAGDMIELDFYDHTVVQAVGFAQAGNCITIGETGTDKFPYDVTSESVTEGDNLAFTPRDFATIACDFADGTKITGN